MTMVGRLPGLGLCLLAALSLARAPAAADTTRIVAIGGAVTETVYALGARDALVAVDTTSLFPPEATRLPNVGYMRQLAAEPIIALQPSLLLVQDDAGPPQTLDQLRAAGLNLVLVPNKPSVDGVVEKIGVIAEALGRPAQGRALAARVKGDVDAVAAAIAGTREHPRVVFLLSIGGGAPLAAGRGTSADGIIKLAGGINAIDGFEGYKPASPEALAALDADVILVTPRTVAQVGGEAGVLALPGVAQTKAASARRIVVIDGLLLLGFGPRTGEGVRTLASALHPGLSLPAP
jgi:iron complex transport system substrate-binding protein